MSQPCLNQVIPKANNGMALILVLASLAILSILVVAFMFSSSSEVNASKLQLSSANTQNLASSALNLVMGQVAEGSSGKNSSNETVSWASQPGMIRTWTSSGGGAEGIFFKLYSSDQMQFSGIGFDGTSVANETPPADWNNRPAIYADLNEPAETSQGLRFPILDPRADKRISGNSGVDGFTFDENAIQGASVSGNGSRVPMPVQWLYVLKDGRFVAPNNNATGTTMATFSSLEVTKDNPIIGRVAFWTDDESCKVNINTASEGVYWDLPIANFNSEQVNYDTNRPAAGEFQRFAGHPATTSLSVLFPQLQGTTPGSRNDAYYEISPRIQQGGSKEGTYSLTISDKAIAPDPDRFYDTVDELAFTQNRSLLSGVSAEQIERRRFFMTAQSRSPETTLFGTPRIAIWPLFPEAPELSSNSSRRNPLEQLIAFASTLGTGADSEYFFTRFNAYSAMDDFADAYYGPRTGRNGRIFSYLQGLTNATPPGYPSSLASKWTATERDQILTETFDYIRSGPNLNGANNPAGWSYTSRYGSSGVTSNNGISSPLEGWVYPTVRNPGEPSETRGFGRFYCVNEVSMLFASKKYTLTGNQTFTLDDNSTVIVPNGIACNQMWPALLIQFWLPSQGLKAASVALRVDVSGLSSFSWSYTDKNGVEQTAPMWTSDTKTFYAMTSSNQGFGTGRAAPGSMGISLLYANSSLNAFWGATLPFTDPAGPSVLNYAQTFKFNGGRVQFTVSPLTAANVSGTRAPLSLPGPQIAEAQTYDITFPSISSLSNPRASQGVNTESSIFGTMTERLTSTDPLTSPETRIVNRPQLGFDVVKSMVVRHGDYRLILGKGNVKGGNETNSINAFIPHPNYLSQNSTTTTQAHTIYRNNSTTLRLVTQRAADLGKLVSGLGPYSSDSVMTPIQPGVTGATMENGAPGDWDSGIGNTPDGAYINKPDEGNDFPPFDYQGKYLNLYTNRAYSLVATQLFGPMKQIASPVMFGSLSTGVIRNQPWQTLLFNPNPASGQTHPGFGSASESPDHLFLDLFWMPVCEPYPISDRFSTAGKINLNYQILPFSYIKRDTGLRAVFKNTLIPAISDSDVGTFKVQPQNNVVTTPGNCRLSINSDQTLAQFDGKFSKGLAFKSASEICEISLVPEGQNWSSSPFNGSAFQLNATNWWNTHRLTGDNLRERPYNAIYPRVTTRSNVFTVYIKAQSLKQNVATLATSPNTFSEGKDVVDGELQTAFTFERYLDPKAPAPANPLSPLGPYKLRVLSQRNLSF